MARWCCSATLTNMLSPWPKSRNHPVRETAGIGSLVVRLTTWRQDTFGMYRTDWTPKPAAGVVRSLASPRSA